MAGIFNEAVLTTKGIALLAKAQAGECAITLTKAATGSGSYSDDDDPQNQTELKNQVQEFALSAVSVQNDTNVYVKFIITNYPSEDEALEEGYYIKEIGLFANDPDDGEILYAIATAVENQWDYLPSYNDLMATTITVEFLTEVANAEEVTIEAPSGTYLYDVSDGTKYVLGIEDGLLYYEEVED